jgi:phage terminase small subunit
MSVTRAQKKFINRYIENDFRNATGAYMNAYPKASYETARVQASRLLAKPNIQECLSAAVAEALGREKLTLEKRIFDVLMKRAFYDITEIVGLKGSLAVTREQLKEKGLDVCIDSINKKINAQGVEEVTYKFADRDRALDTLQRYIRMIHEKTEIEFITPETRAALAAVFSSSPPEAAG